MPDGDQESPRRFRADWPGVAAVVGAASVTVGVWGLVGWWWAAVAAGVFLIVGGVLSA